MHKLKDSSIKPIAHTSRTLLPDQKNYSVKEKESLRIVFVINKFNRFLHGSRFAVQMDHRPLIAIFWSKKSLPTHTANRLQRWGTILFYYDFWMKFLTLCKLNHADGLSKLIPKNSAAWIETSKVW